jgi:hypothetical protein
MASRADLEKITDKLEQAYAILAYSGAPARRLTTVRTLLRPFHSGDLPTSATRVLWMYIGETMLRLGGGVATSEELHSLGHQIRQLRDMIHAHLAYAAG